MAETSLASEESSKPQTKGNLTTLHPVKTFYKLRERYSEDTADVFFVDKETKERLPAHREVLKVNSDVFFKMFNGDWKEKEEKEIPAPEEYNWESFKAAITLLYGEEVEMEESSIPDIYRVAHCYDLKEVVYVLIRDMHQWDSSIVAAVMKLYTVVVMLEIGKGGMKSELLQAVMQYFARNLKNIPRETLAEFSYQAVLMLVQSEEIEISEMDLLSRLKQWIKDHPSLTIVEGEKLLSHIRFGTIPYETLIACEVWHENLSLALKNYHQPSCLAEQNMIQFTPRTCQKDITPVFPVTPDPTVLRQSSRGNQLECVATLSPAVGMMYFGRQKVSFEGSIGKVTEESCTLVCELSTITGVKRSNKAVANLQDEFTCNGGLVKFYYGQFSVTLSQTGAHIVLKCTDSPISMLQPYEYSYNRRQRTITTSLELRFSSPFPWLLTFGLTHRCSPHIEHFTFTYPCSS